MATLFIFYSLLISITCALISSSKLSRTTLISGSSLSVEKPNDDVLTSSDGVFSAGFFSVGVNAFTFAVWFNEPASPTNGAVVWTANRDLPVNGKRSELSLHKTGNLVLTDADAVTVWSTATASQSLSSLHLHNSGNLVLLTSDGVVLWQSFDSPTDTLLPEQPLTRHAKLVSGRSQTNVSSGFYKLLFDSDNVLRLIFDSFSISSVYWPAPWRVSWDNGRSTYNNSKTAVLDLLGNFSSSDDFTFMSADYGAKTQRMLRLDCDGNVRLYSRKNLGDKWVVAWQAFTDPCQIHGVCGPNSLCTHSSEFGRKCSCLVGHKMKNHSDWFYGCEPEYTLSCPKNESSFIKLFNTDFYGYDYGFFPNYTFQACQDLCLKLCHCVGFHYSYKEKRDFLSFSCYPKYMLVNGAQKSNVLSDIYLRVPKNFQLALSPEKSSELGLDCSNKVTTQIATTYKKSNANTSLVNFMLWFACGVGGLEVICIVLVWSLIRTRKNSVADDQSYLLATTGFKRFSFSELKKATRGFSEEIGRGAGGIVYRAVLSDSRVAAVKKITDGQAHQGAEAEFLSEVNTIGRLNHMNVIQMWGYCAEKKHRLLVYEYLEHGSLKEKLSTKTLDWKMRFEIALGAAKGLAYLHDECLEWVLHCDVKSQNILLSADYQPKVADFGLAKLLSRGEQRHLSFSRIRGTRGYMAPEWVTNQSITSKVDVYSYGVVLLEILTGISPIFHDEHNGKDGTRNRGLVTWVKENVNGGDEVAGKIIDRSVVSEGECDTQKMEILLCVALKCVEEGKDDRPTMQQVVEMLQNHQFVAQSKP